MRLARGGVRALSLHPKLITDLRSGLKSDAAAEKFKHRLSQDFHDCSIFDFCNNICQ
jgi:hypothetical protein